MSERNFKTREGYDIWDKLCAIPKYGFVIGPSGGVVKVQDLSNWIDREEAQRVVDEAQSEVNLLREERDQLRAELAAIRGQEPVAVTAVAVTYSNVNDDLRLRWLLEGGIAELEMPGQVLLVADAQITDDEGHGEVYLLQPQQPDAVSVPREFQPHDYRQDLQCWFGLGRASWCTIPRVLMEAMPEEWQRRAAILLHEYSEAFPGGSKLPTPYVQARFDGKITKWPAWINNYRHPDRAAIESLRLSTRQAEEGE